MKHTSQLKNWNIKNKNIIVRTDYNVPIAHNSITNDFRIKASLPTIDYILKNGGTPIIITHIGRPEHKDPELSTQLIATWFAHNTYAAHFAPTINDAQQLAQKYPNSIIVLENIRFFPEEQKKDAQFACTLSQLGDYYVNDAFGTMHRDDTSITLLPTLFDTDHKTIGLLVQKELNTFDSIIHHAQKPFVAILGGGKVADKIPLIEKMLNTADAILLCPAIAFTFAQSQNKKMGNSLIDPNLTALCANILKKAETKNATIELPRDYQIAAKTIDGALSYTDSDEIPDDHIGIAIGPQTIKHYCSIIKTANIIFFNGAMGFQDKPNTMHAQHALLRTAAESDATTIIAGGDSVATAHNANITKAIDHLSTGGGAALSYIINQSLPAIDVLFD